MISCYDRLYFTTVVSHMVTITVSNSTTLCVHLYVKRVYLDSHAVRGDDFILKYDFHGTRRVVHFAVWVKNVKPKSFTIVHNHILYFFAVTMEAGCSFGRSYSMNENQTITLEWKGSNPGLNGCEYGFYGYDVSDVLKEYKTCVETTEFFLESKGIRVKFTSGEKSMVGKVTFQIIG